MAMSESTAGYHLGSDEPELARLELQGRALAPATRTIFAAAGIRPGMRVLDLGCGTGDVTFVAADMVGRDGLVVGVDRSPQALARARISASQLGLTQVQLAEGDIHAPAPGGPYDAIIGRLVLMYVPDPVSVLRQQVTVLRSGGVVVPIEFDVSTARTFPAVPLHDQAVSWLTEAFTRAGVELSLGLRLWEVLREAGLRPLGMLGVQPYFGPSDPDGAALLAGIIDTAAPLIERTGVATAEEIGAETFLRRLEGELRENSAVLAYPMLLSAWATTDTV
jgi:SAM-dependent methyltransferase